MKPHDAPYYICKLYVDDAEPVVSADLVNYVRKHLEKRDLQALCDCVGLLNDDYHRSVDFTFCHQVRAFFSKNADLCIKSSCLQNAEFSFIEAECQCYLTNKALNDDAGSLVRDPIIIRMQDWIRDVLGSLDQYGDSLPYMLRLTSGASLTRSRRESKPHLRLSPKMMVSPKAAPYLESLAHWFGFERTKFGLCGLNRVEFVPKNWKTFRTIACEPEGNLLLQLSLDTWLKGRLRKFFRIDLTDQSRNRDLAKLGSIDGSYSTIDLESASDTIAKDVVRLLLPEEWFHVFDCFRSPCYINPVTGFVRPYEKFSSMGNGSTFVLETLIFAAVCVAHGARDFSVYGDDIVIPSDIFSKVTATLSKLGFTVNRSKTYSTGFFRESCGKHYHRGYDVTPFYLRSWNVRKDSIRYHNINGLSSISIHAGKHLEGFVLSLIQKDDLLVPFNGMSTSGIFINIGDAYELQLFRRNKKEFNLWYRAFVPISRSKRVADIRTYYLWFFLKQFKSNLRGHTPLDAFTESSRITNDRLTYRRRFVRWIPPAQATPSYLYWWTDQVTEYLRKKGRPLLCRG